MKLAKSKSVIPECYIDSNLFDVLLNFEKESVNHAKGNGTVLNKMERMFANSFCIGIIDKDRRDLTKIKTNFVKVEIEGIEDYLILYQSCKNKHHYLIQIVPAIELWIWNVTDKLSIEIGKFDIHALSLDEFKKITKQVDKKRDARFRALFKEIVNQSDLKQFLPVIKLKSIINLILDKNYQVDINELMNV